MRLKLFGTNIYVSFLFAALIALLLATDRTGLAVPTLFAVFVHETGHLFAMWVLDCAPKSIKLIPAGIQITRSPFERYKKDVAVALVGPLVNLVIFITLYINYLCFKNEITLIYALINLIVGVFNLLPVKGLDGGTILYSLVASRAGINKAALILRLITSLLAVGIFIAAVTLTLRGRVNLSMYIMALYLFLGVIIKM